MYKKILIKLQPYGLAIVSSGTAFGLTLLFQSWLVPGIFSLFYLAVIVSAFYGNIKAALLTTILSAFAYNYFLLTTPYFQRVFNSNTVVQLIIFVFMMVLLGGICAAQRSTNQPNTNSLNYLQNFSNKERLYHRIVDIVIESFQEFFLSNERLKLASEKISEQKRIEEALRKSEERFRIVQELSLDAFTILRSVRDATGKIVDFEWEYVNPKAAEILGQPIEKLVGHRLLQVLPGNKTNSELFDRYVQAVETGIPHDIEIPYNSEGINGWFRNMTVKLNDGVAISFGDISKRKQEEVERINLLERERSAREEAEVANRIKDEFLAILSHELRSPLNPILGWSELLLTREFDQATTRRALETIERNARLQTQLIEDLLDVSRILQGKLSLNISPVDLQFIIEAAIETVYLAAEAKSINLQFFIEDQVMAIGDAELMTGKAFDQFSIPNQKFWVLADPNRLQQIIWNLLSNAVKFTSPGGKVEIRLSLASESGNVGEENQVSACSQYAQIQVKDTGKGIFPDFLPYVFDYFRQENSSTTRKFGGLGLGLAIVRHLAELHGGKVLADSAGEGTGATFTFLLPLMVVESSVVEDRSKCDRKLDLNGISILVVDDDADTRDFLVFMLQEYGARVTAVDSAFEALKALPQLKPDLLLSDIGMPNMNGYTLIRQVRNLPSEQGGKIPAIALTAYAGEADYKQALSAGFQIHLSKPVEASELAKAVASLIDRN